jgi:16S rRNA processing protein RimM
MKSSSSTESEDPRDTQVLVGVVLGPHGIRGEVAVSVESDNPERFAPGSTLTLTFPRRPRAGPGTEGSSLRVARTIPHKGGLRVAFEGVVDRDAAERLRGGELSVPRSDVPPPPRGSFYEFELLGMACHDAVAGELGEVVGLVADGGGWILEVEGAGPKSRRRVSLPFVEEFLVRVDREARRIDWRLPEGLLEACASES